MTDDASTRAGVAALQNGRPADARRHFEAAAAGSNDPQVLLYLAHSCQLTGDIAAADAALGRLLTVQPDNLYGLVMRGELRMAAGDERAAISFFQFALGTVPPGAALPPDLIERLDRAEAAVAATQIRFREHLEAELGAAAVNPADQSERFREALVILSGEQPIQLQQPTSFFYPGLPHTAFYDTDRISWLAAMLDELPAMQAELEAVLREDIGFEPYIRAEPSRPNRGHALLDDPRWGALYLWENGVPVERNAARCPRTMAALAHAPIPRIAGRSPMALFSLLRPNTHIPPHHGMLNTRLICHIPLIVPPQCRLRVGNMTRPVELGRPMLFDDSIEHEAWNDSDEVRVVLLFEVWRPELEMDERRALTALFEAPGKYG